eukprot:14009075-Alexandrium_andersonii.AAC.1
MQETKVPVSQAHDVEAFVGKHGLQGSVLPCFGWGRGASAGLLTAVPWHDGLGLLRGQEACVVPGRIAVHWWNGIMAGVV